jgi:hypothetical protein
VLNSVSKQGEQLQEPTCCVKLMAMMPRVKTMNSLNVLKMELLQEIMSGLANLQLHDLNYPGEKHYLWKSSTDYPRSCRRGWNI